MSNWTKTNTFVTKISDSGSDKIPSTFNVSGSVNGTLTIGKWSDSANAFPRKENFLLKSDSKVIKLINNDILDTANLNVKQSLLFNSILGSYAPFTKTFIIRGIGYQADIVENSLTGTEVKEFPYSRYLSLRVGHSYHLYIPVPDFVGIKVSHKDRKLTIYGANKEQVANFAKNIFKLRLPSVYTGRGIRIKKGMHRRKLGKKDIRKGKV